MTIKVTIGGKEYSLTFGMIAVEEVQNRTVLNLQSGPATVGNTKALTDIFYAGFNNHADLSDGAIPRIKYSEAAGIIEELVYSEDTELQAVIVDAFKNSRATKVLVAKFENPDKKKAQKKRIPKK